MLVDNTMSRKKDGMQIEGLKKKTHHLDSKRGAQYLLACRTVGKKCKILDKYKYMMRSVSMRTYIVIILSSKRHDVANSVSIVPLHVCSHLMQMTIISELNSFNESVLLIFLHCYPAFVILWPISLYSTPHVFFDRDLMG